MIRVGFILNFHDQGWIGGINYYHSLIDAILSVPSRKIEPVVITGTESDLPFIKDHPNIEIIHTKIFDKPWNFVRFGIRKLLSYDLVLEQLLRKNRIDVLSHSGYVFHNAIIPTVGWIPDFQHKHLPYFFSDKEIQSRDKAFEGICRLCHYTIFSSSSAKEDAEKYYPEYSSRYEVLRFVPAPVNLNDIPDMITLKEKYSISEPYFLVPNQFWVHKNHRIVVEALKILHSQGKRVRVICTGNTHDYRSPEHYDSLVEFAVQSGVLDEFTVLGIVPYPDLIGLMLHSVSLINPSFFEGWSTTVEEAKFLDLPIILSDIPVHREQNPTKGIYFHPEDAESLANIMWQLWTPRNICNRDLSRISAKREMDMRKLEFGKQYEDIILRVMDSMP